MEYGGLLVIVVEETVGPELLPDKIVDCEDIEDETDTMLVVVVDSDISEVTVPATVPSSLPGIADPTPELVNGVGIDIAAVLGLSAGSSSYILSCVPS